MYIHICIYTHTNIHIIQCVSVFIYIYIYMYMYIYIYTVGVDKYVCLSHVCLLACATPGLHGYVSNGDLTIVSPTVISN